MKVIVGLGNPGRAYQRTPHNAGFEVIDEIARESGAAWKKSWRFPLESAEFRVDHHEVLLVKPTTFMNRSGEAVAPMLRKKGVGLADLLVLVDDIDLPLGKVRLRARGSAGTHNGMKSMIERLGSPEFARLRIGVGPAPAGRDLAAFVLDRYPAAVREDVDALYRRSAEGALAWVKLGVEKAMNEFNG